MRIISLLLPFLILSSCTYRTNESLQRSANNKLFDRKGFQGGKRAPLYNKKYITQAKQNILRGEYDDEYDDEEFEAQDAASRNVSIYKEMIEREVDKRQRNKRSKNRDIHRRAYPSIIKANAKVEHNESHNTNLELREELEQIKSMLKDAKKDISSYKCPTAQELENQNSKKADYKNEIRSNDSKTTQGELIKDQDTSVDESTTHTYPSTPDKESTYVESDVE